MHTVAILGAGDLAGALARTLAARDAVSRVVLVDEARGVATGKALDIRQAGPVECYDTLVEGTDEVERAAEADLVVVADRHGAGDWEGEDGLELVRRVAALAPEPAIVFAGARHHALMGAAVDELQVPPARLVGSAPLAASGAARALTAAEIGVSPVDIGIPVLGVPPRWVLAWGHATAAGSPVDGLSAHAAGRIEETLTSRWSAGPYALASAAAAVVRAMLAGSRRRFCCYAATPFGGIRPVVFSAPVVLGPKGVARVVLPDLTPRQRVQLEATVLSGR